MALPTSGPLSLQQIALEFGGTAPHSLSEYYGVATGIPTSGTISIANFYGNTSIFTLTVSTSTANPDIHSLATASGWNTTQPLTVNITAPFINSLRLDGTKLFPQGLVINISAGTVVGGLINSGTAIYVRVPVTINNSGTIAGGGGKGGTGQVTYFRYRTDPLFYRGEGGIGGNGQGFANTSATSVTAATIGANGTKNTYSGDVVGGDTAPWAEGGKGGNGGAWGVSGQSGLSGTYGGSYTDAGEWTAATAGSTAGKYVDGNSFVTWGTLGTRLGTFS